MPRSDCAAGPSPARRSPRAPVDVRLAALEPKEPLHHDELADTDLRPPPLAGPRSSREAGSSFRRGTGSERSSDARAHAPEAQLAAGDRDAAADGQLVGGEQRLLGQSVGSLPTRTSASVTEGGKIVKVHAPEAAPAAVAAPRGAAARRPGRATGIGPNSRSRRPPAPGRGRRSERDGASRVAAPHAPIHPGPCEDRRPCALAARRPRKACSRADRSDPSRRGRRRVTDERWRERRPECRRGSGNPSWPSSVR